MNKVYLLIISLIFCSCVKKVSIDDFDDAIWKDDPYACKLERIELIESLLDQKEKLINLSQNEVKALLGAPDEHELYSRNQKFFKYYTEPSSKCEKPKENARYLQIRFNALGYVSEVNYSF